MTDVFRNGYFILRKCIFQKVFWDCGANKMFVPLSVTLGAGLYDSGYPAYTCGAVILTFKICVLLWSSLQWWFSWSSSADPCIAQSTWKNGCPGPQTPAVPAASLKEPEGTEHNAWQQWRDAETQKRGEVLAWSWSWVWGGEGVSQTAHLTVWFLSLNIWMDYQKFSVNWQQRNKVKFPKLRLFCLQVSVHLMSLGF